MARTPFPAGSDRASVRGKFTIRGKERLIRKLKEISDDFESDAEQILMIGAEHIRDAAERNAPYDESRKSGTHLKNHIITAPLTGTSSITGKSGDFDPDSGEAAVGIGPDKKHFYGIFPEIGTKHQPAQPWLRPAFDSQVDKAEETVRKELKAIIEKYTIAGL